MTARSVNDYRELIVNRYQDGILSEEKALRLVAKLDEWEDVAKERGLT